jgi:integrase
VVFANSAARLKTGDAGRSLLPMTGAEIRAVEQVAVSPAQRLIVTLAAVHAARPAAIRELTLDDLDLPNRRITIAGTPSDSANSPTRSSGPGSTIAALPGRTPPTGTS